MSQKALKDIHMPSPKTSKPKKKGVEDVKQALKV